MNLQKKKKKKNQKPLVYIMAMSRDLIFVRQKYVVFKRGKCFALQSIWLNETNVILMYVKLFLSRCIS